MVSTGGGALLTMTLRNFLRAEIASAYPAKEGAPDLRAAAVGMGVKYGTLFAYVAEPGVAYGRPPSPGALGRMLDSLKLGERKRAEARRLLEAAVRPARDAAAVA
jgi:hypothetical protein